LDEGVLNRPQAYTTIKRPQETFARMLGSTKPSLSFSLFKE
jgi:hypothetical protein